MKSAILNELNFGGMPEWLNGPHSKCGIPVRVSGVRIPLPPFVKILLGRSDRIVPKFSLNMTSDGIRRVFQKANVFAF